MNYTSISLEVHIPEPLYFQLLGYLDGTATANQDDVFISALDLWFMNSRAVTSQ